MSFFPIDDRHFIASDYLSDLDLPQSEVEPALTNGFAHCSWIGRVAFYHGKVWPFRATNPI